jgi:hypothetical protein
MRLPAAFLGLALLLVPSTFVRADAFDPKSVPSDAKWVIHLDADALQASKLWGLVYKKAQDMPQAQAGIDQLEAVGGMSFPKDLHGVTMYGNSFQADSIVILLKAHSDQDKALAVLKGNPTYASTTYGSYEIHSWQDNGKTMFGSYHDAGLVVISSSEKNVQTALDAIDHKGQTLHPSATLRDAMTNGKLFFIAGDGLFNIKTPEPQNPMLAQMDSAWLGASEAGKDFVMHASMSAKTVDAAQQLQTSAEGIKAMVVLSATSQNTDPRMQAAADALDRMTTALNGTTVTVDLPVSLDMIKQNIDNAVPKVAPATTSP